MSPRRATISGLRHRRYIRFTRFADACRYADASGAAMLLCCARYYAVAATLLTMPGAAAMMLPLRRYAIASLMPLRHTFLRFPARRSLSMMLPQMPPLLIRCRRDFLYDV